MLPYEAVSPVLIAEIQKWYSNGAEEDDVIERLRLRQELIESVGRGSM